ncbi:MAG: beta strand repeat-containing protein [Gemmatimonadaceae bacterium]
MNFSRKTILVVGAALLAACGDKVTVTDYKPTPTTPKVNFVEVTPATATVSTGASITFTAAVNADAGLATTVTWSASAGAVTAAGVFTAPATANPGISVCATSTVDTGKKGCATVVVSPPAATFPATVSIASITTGALNVPVNPLAVAGQMDVTLNINPGTQTISKVELLVGGVVAGSQTFTAAQSAALRYAADEALAAQTTFPQVVFSVNTAAFNATTGAPTYLNGSQAVQAKVYTTASGTSTAASASVTQNLVFANVNAFAITTTVGGTTATANNAAGYRYTKGDLSVAVLPISYSGQVLAAGTVTFGTLACNNNAVQPSKALTAPAAGAYAWTGAWTNSGTDGSAANVRNYEFNSVACPAAYLTGETVAIAAAQDANGNPFTTTALPIAGGAGFRIDNRPPNAEAAFVVGNTIVNPNGRALSWVNDAVSFVTIGGAGLNGMIAAPAITDGIGAVGGVTYAAKVGATLATATAAADITDPTTLAASATNANYCLLQYAQDALGNRTPVPAACLQTFGVDRAAPTIAYSGGITANSRFAAAPGAGNEFIVTVNDTGLVGNSGMLPAAPATGKIIFRGNGNSAAQACFFGTIVSSVCTENPLVVSPAIPLYGSATMAATPGNTVATEGYYTFSGTAFDAAGNSATVASRTTLVDATAATVGAASGPLSVASGYTFPVSALVNEALDIQSYWFNATYGAGVGAFAAPATLPQGTVTAVNGYNAATFINTNYQINSTYNLPVAIQATAPGVALTAVTAITASATNQANTITTGATAAIPVFGTPATAMSTVSWTAFTAAVLPAGKTGISSGLSTAATTAKPASSTLSVTTTGATAVFNNPFAKVDFYGLSVGGAWVFLGTTTASSLTDDGATRTFTYSIPVSGATVFAALGGTAATLNQNVIAFGYKADGSVAMVNAAALVLNVVY